MRAEDVGYYEGRLGMVPITREMIEDELPLIGALYPEFARQWEDELRRLDDRLTFSEELTHTAP